MFALPLVVVAPAAQPQTFQPQTQSFPALAVLDQAAASAAAALRTRQVAMAASQTALRELTVLTA